MELWTEVCDIVQEEVIKTIPKKKKCKKAKWLSEEALQITEKSRDITLPAKVCLVKAMVFPVVMYLLSAIWVVSSTYLRLLIFLLAILIPACASSSPGFLMMYSAYKLNKQGDNIEP